MWARHPDAAVVRVIGGNSTSIDVPTGPALGVVGHCGDQPKGPGEFRGAQGWQTRGDW
jgi:hypothetical protein